MKNVDRIKELETLFSSNQYDGGGETPFFICEGIGSIMVSAPHAVNQFREGSVKWADRYTGGIAMHLHEITGCPIICASKFNNSDPNYDPIGSNEYQDTLKDFVELNDIKFLIDLHGAAQSRGYAMEMGTAPEQNPMETIEYEEDPSLHQYKYIADLIKNLFENKFAVLDNEKKEVWKNVIFDAGDQNTVTKFITENTSTAGIQLEINALYRNPENIKECNALIEGLIELIEKLRNAKWI